LKIFLLFVFFVSFLRSARRVWGQGPGHEVLINNLQPRFSRFFLGALFLFFFVVYALIPRSPHPLYTFFSGPGHGICSFSSQLTQMWAVGLSHTPPGRFEKEIFSSLCTFLGRPSVLCFFAHVVLFLSWVPAVSPWPHFFKLVLSFASCKEIPFRFVCLSSNRWFPVLSKGAAMVNRLYFKGINAEMLDRLFCAWSFFLFFLAFSRRVC